jgi:hypothetical protein
MNLSMTMHEHRPLCLRTRMACDEIVGNHLVGSGPLGPVYQSLSHLGRLG